SLESFDGNNKDIRGIVTVDLMRLDGIPNRGAAWNHGFNRGEIWYGDGIENGILHEQPVTLDITAHEFGHGIYNKFILNDTPQNDIGETFSLKESFSDIWGACVEYSVLGVASASHNPWEIGEQNN